MHWGLEPCSSIKQGHEYKKKKEVDERSQQNSKLKKSKKKKKMYRSEQKTKTVHLQWVPWRESWHLLTTDRKWCRLYRGTWLNHRYRKSPGGKDCVAEWELQMGVQLPEKQWDRETNTGYKMSAGQRSLHHAKQEPAATWEGVEEKPTLLWSPAFRNIINS